MSANGLERLRERYDAVLLDLDGTLLDARSRLTPRSHRAVRRLVDAGFLVLICTGRSVTGTLDVYGELGLDTHLVAFNGGYIGRPGETPWRLSPIPDDFVADVERAEAFAAFSFRHLEESKFTVPSGHPDYDQVAAWYAGVRRVADRSALPRTGLMRVSCYYDGEAPAEAAWESVSTSVRPMLRREVFPLRIFDLFKHSTLVLGEIQAGGRGKAEVLVYLEKEHGVPPERTIAIGDQRNDLTLLGAAGLAVCVANAVDEVRAVADLVIGDHDEEGVAAWIEAGAPETM